MSRPPALRGEVATAMVSIVTFICLIATPALGTQGSAVPSVWNIATSPTPVGSWTAVDYGAGHWIALGTTDEVAVSSDGTSWTEYPVSSGSWRSVAYGDGEFVALSSLDTGSEEMVSTDGVTWSVSSGPSGSWSSVIFAHDRFVAVSSHGQIDISTDGVRWTQVWSHSNYDLTSVTYGSGRYVAVDSALGATLISRNGLVWSRYLPPRPGLHWGAVVYGNGNFVAFGGTGVGAGLVATSLFGNDWTFRQFSPAQAIDSATYGCGNFVASGGPTGSDNSFITSPTGALWSTAPVPIDVTSTWTALAYGAHRFVAVDSDGNIAWSSTSADCATSIPTAPQQVSGNVHSGQVWTYMHPSDSSGGAPINGYRVTISNGAFTRQCSAPVYFEPNCIINGLRNHQVYWLTAQAHNRFGYSVTTDPVFVIPVASELFSAVGSKPVMSTSAPVVVQVTGVVSHDGGIYATSLITVHFGDRLFYCHANVFGECLITIPNPAVGRSSVFATYSAFGGSHQSPTTEVVITS